jgi:HEAT repeat protein
VELSGRVVWKAALEEFVEPHSIRQVGDEIVALRDGHVVRISREGRVTRQAGVRRSSGYLMARGQIGGFDSAGRLVHAYTRRMLIRGQKEAPPCWLEENEPDSGKLARKVTLNVKGGERANRVKISPTDADRVYVIGPEELLRADLEGRVAWAKKLPAVAAQGLRNGNVVVVCYGGDLDNRALELDGKQRVVWESVTEDDVLSGVVVFPLVRFGFARPEGEETDLDGRAARLASLKSPRKEVRRRGLLGLRQLPITEAVWKAGVAALKDPDVTVRHEAIELVGRYEGRRDQTAKLLLALLSEKDELTNWHVTGQPVFGHKEVMPLLVRLANDADQPKFLRYECASLLVAHLSRPDKGVRTAIRWGLKSGGREPRLSILWRLRECADGNVEEFAKELVALLQAPDEPVVWRTTELLVRVGKKLVPFIPDLLKAMERRSSRAAAAEVLRPLAPSHAAVRRAVAAQLMKDKSDVLGNVQLLECLKGVGGDADVALDQLVLALDDRQRHPHHIDEASVRPVQLLAIEVLGNCGGRAKPAVDKLFGLVRDRKEPLTVREAAVKTLRKIDPSRGEEASKLLQRDK